MRRNVFFIFLVAAVFALLFGLFSAVGVAPAASGVGTANACNPCECPNDRRVNCQGIEFYALYTRVTANTCTIDAYRFNDRGTSRRVWRVTDSELEDVPERPAQNTLIEENDGIAIYRLTSGELQVNAGPDGENKIYTAIFEGCPPRNVRENSFTPGQ